MPCLAPARDAEKTVPHALPERRVCGTVFSSDGRAVSGRRPAVLGQRPVYRASRFSSVEPMASIMSAEARKPAFHVATKRLDS